MANRKFSEYLEESTLKGKTPRRKKESLDWLKDGIKSFSKRNKAIESGDVREIRSWTNVGIGSMYMVHYDPKHADSLKYYDTFPLIVPIHRYKDGFLALNLHYLPPTLRANLLDALFVTINNDKMDDTTKMKISYRILTSVAKNKYYKPCVKRYLSGHFKTTFLKVAPEKWENAIHLPVESFQKASKEAVWKDSKRIIRGK